MCLVWEKSDLPLATREGPERCLEQTLPDPFHTRGEFP